MLSTNPQTVAAASPATLPQPNFRGRWWIRITLFVLHIAIVLAVGISLTPDGYAFQFGESYGSLLVGSSILLWFLLFGTQTRRGIFVFCGLVLGQASFVALIGLQYRAEDRLLQSIAKEATLKRTEWAKKMEPYRMDPLFEMASGNRELSITELQELQNRARDGRANLGKLHSDIDSLTADAERRLAAKIGSRAADNFRRGVENSRHVVDEQMKLMHDYFAASEQLAGFLIDRRGQYAQTSTGLKFKKDEDAQYLNDQLNLAASLQERLASINQRVELEYGKGATDH